MAAAAWLDDGVPALARRGRRAAVLRRGGRARRARRARAAFGAPAHFRIGFGLEMPRYGEALGVLSDVLTSRVLGSRGQGSVSKLRVNSFSVSLDGYGAGPTQTSRIRSASAARRCITGCSARARFGSCSARKAADGRRRRLRAARLRDVGAWILGRNMFGPVRGPWPDESWRGWWGDDPPYHCDVFVLTLTRAQVARDAGRHYVPLRDRRHRGGARSARARRPAATTCGSAAAGHDPAVSARRFASTSCISRSRPCCSVPARRYSRASTCRPRLRRHGARPDARCHPRRADEAPISSRLQAAVAPTRERRRAATVLPLSASGQDVFYSRPPGGFRC